MPMSPSEQSKEAGLDSFVEMVRITGMSDSTLRHWHKNKPHQFSCVLAGAVALKYNRNSCSSVKDDVFLKKWSLLNSISENDLAMIAQLVKRFMDDK